MGILGSCPFMARHGMVGGRIPGALAPADERMRLRRVSWPERSRREWRMHFSFGALHPSLLLETSLPPAFQCRRSPRFRRAFGCAQNRECGARGSPPVSWRNGEILPGCWAGPSRELEAGGSESENGAWHHCGDVSDRGQGVAIGSPGTSDQVCSSRGCRRKFGRLAGGSSCGSCSETLRPGAGRAGSMARPPLLSALKRPGR